uniref:LAGLIDADG homing endonuclease n=1 Tax=Cyathus stercoreus TaxID=181520 RepID=UPI002551EAA5|nr:LAGLIDADG homing endonuclease [Cyathus stercoreus]WEV87329.1 LAGLIDADG homing endonuclease [Cyathus stercoreus]
MTMINNKTNNNLPQELHSILIGIMLSDGGLYRSSPTANVRFEMSFGEKYQSLAFHIGYLFKDYMSNPVKSIEVKGKNKVYSNYRLKTKTLPLFNSYYEMFYKYQTEPTNKYVKVVPDNIIDLMDPIVLAYLIQGDGNYDKTRNRVRIYTNSYQKQEVEKLALAINTKLNIYTAVLHDRKDQWILTIGAKNLKVLRENVIPYFHPTMLYRIGI